jgi:hypothetical protein
MATFILRLQLAEVFKHPALASTPPVSASDTLFILMDSNTTENGDLDRDGTYPTNAPSQADTATSMSVTPEVVTTKVTPAKWGVIYSNARLGHKFRRQFWRFPSSWSELVNDGHSIVRLPFLPYLSPC